MLKGIRSPNFLFHIWIELDEKITFVKEPPTWDAWFGQERPPNIERLPNFTLYFVFFYVTLKFGRWQQSAWRAYILRPSHHIRICYISNESSNIELSFNLLKMSVALIFLERQSIRSLLKFGSHSIFGVLSRPNQASQVSGFFTDIIFSSSSIHIWNKKFGGRIPLNKKF